MSFATVNPKETAALMSERKALESIKPWELTERDNSDTQRPLPKAYMPLIGQREGNALSSTSRSRLLTALRSDSRLTAREKVQVSLLSIIATRKGSEMRVASATDVARRDALRTVQAKDTCTWEDTGCIMQRHTENIDFAVAEQFLGLEKALTCVELSKITQLNDEWYKAAINHGDESAEAAQAKRNLTAFIKNLRIVYNFA